MQARRVHVTGNAGAGKTTFATLLGRELGLPVFSLDSVVWQPGWRKTPPDERERLETLLIQRPAWVIEGVSQRVRDAADFVVFLDLPRRVCLWRVLRRYVRHFGDIRPGLPPGCVEWRILPRLLRVVWTFPANAGTKIRSDAPRDEGRYHTLLETPKLAPLLQRLRGP